MMRLVRILESYKFLRRMFSHDPRILSSTSVVVDIGLFFGIYSLSNPIKPTLRPIWRFLKGSAKYVVIPNTSSTREYCENSVPLSKVIAFTLALIECNFLITASSTCFYIL